MQCEAESSLVLTRELSAPTTKNKLAPAGMLPHLNLNLFNSQYPFGSMPNQYKENHEKFRTGSKYLQKL